ncbi:MAG: hypothetical protein U5Q44_04115 [Dehalococcoidia bacterium]|nr:hypothetical protein [Dehalococcoidia bacterium]
MLAQASGVYSLVGFSGDIDRNEVQLALLEPLTGAYGDDWWYLCQLAFAENELFQFEKARGHAERSLELHNGNGHGAHTMAHVHFETGEVADGEAFLAGWLPGYDPKAQMAGHLSWHHALFALLQGDTAEADRIYREHLRPGNATSAALGLIADAASLLWRRGLGGERQDDSWPGVRDFAATAFPKPGIMFADLPTARWPTPQRVTRPAWGSSSPACGSAPRQARSREAR